jgi:hypothetical protein
MKLRAKYCNVHEGPLKHCFIFILEMVIYLLFHLGCTGNLYNGGVVKGLLYL